MNGECLRRPKKGTTIEEEIEEMEKYVFHFYVFETLKLICRQSIATNFNVRFNNLATNPTRWIHDMNLVLVIIVNGMVSRVLLLILNYLALLFSYKLLETRIHDTWSWIHHSGEWAA